MKNYCTLNNILKDEVVNYIKDITKGLGKSTHIERMMQNIDVFDFELSDEDMELIATMNDKKSQFFSHRDPKMVEWFANIVEERKINHVAAK